MPGLGGNATIKQVYAVVVHSLTVLALQQLLVYPLDYAEQSLSSPTNLAVFLPFLDEGSFTARLFGAVDLFLDLVDCEPRHRPIRPIQEACDANRHSHALSVRGCRARRRCGSHRVALSGA